MALSFYPRKLANMLLPGGIVFIYEMHPVTVVLNDNRNENPNPLMAENPYFTKEPFCNDKSLDHIGKTKEKGKMKYWFTHTISDAIMGLINNNIQIKFFQEYEHDIFSVYELLERQNAHFPLSYILIGEKSI